MLNMSSPKGVLEGHQVIVHQHFLEGSGGDCGKPLCYPGSPPSLPGSGLGRQHYSLAPRGSSSSQVRSVGYTWSLPRQKSLSPPHSSHRTPCERKGCWPKAPVWPQQGTAADSSGSIFQPWVEVIWVQCVLNWEDVLEWLQLEVWRGRNRENTHQGGRRGLHLCGGDVKIP